MSGRNSNRLRSLMGNFFINEMLACLIMGARSVLRLGLPQVPTAGTVYRLMRTLLSDSCGNSRKADRHWRATGR